MKSEGSAGFVRSVSVALAVLGLVIIVVGLVYLVPRADGEYVGRVSEDVTDDLSRAAVAVRETSEDLITAAKVKTALAISKSVQAFAIDVDAQDGTVTLTGQVPSAEVEATALELARDTSGVVDVIDRIDVDAAIEPSLSGEMFTGRLADAELKALVYESFLRAGDLDARAVRVVVHDRIVTLTGTVENARDRERAEVLAASVAGVDSVTSELVLGPPAPRTTAVPRSERSGRTIR